MGLRHEVDGQLFVAEGGVLKSGQSINSHLKRRRGNSHLIVFRLMRPYWETGGGYKKATTKTRSVCGPSNPVVWYTAPLKLTVVFIVALEISLVKLQAWPVYQGCLSLPTAHSPARTPSVQLTRRLDLQCVRQQGWDEWRSSRVCALDSVNV